MNRTLQTMLAIAGAALLVQTGEAKDNDRYARLVLFIPADTEPPENYEARLGSLALRTEAFFAEWMEHWKRAVERKQIFARNDDGSIAVTLVKGKLFNANGRAALPDLRAKALKSASSQLDLPPDPGTIWWIFYHYPGVKGFQGGARGTGGIAINAYPEGRDLIDPESALAEGILAEMAIKGAIHEFGHALGLPHIGPRPGLVLGNSLMGPVNKAYWSKSGSDDPRVYLDEASAAALWKHPIFQREASPEPEMPSDVKVADLETAKSTEGPQIVIEGTLSASIPAHTAIVLDSERGQFGDYWARSYSAAVDDASGRFAITIDEPFDKGTFFLVFCFDNGLTTADGKMLFQRGSSITIPH